MLLPTIPLCQHCTACRVGWVYVFYSNQSTPRPSPSPICFTPPHRLCQPQRLSGILAPISSHTNTPIATGECTGTTYRRLGWREHRKGLGEEQGEGSVLHPFGFRPEGTWPGLGTHATTGSWREAGPVRGYSDTDNT